MLITPQSVDVAVDHHAASSGRRCGIDATCDLQPQRFDIEAANPLQIADQRMIGHMGPGPFHRVTLIWARRHIAFSASATVAIWA